MNITVITIFPKIIEEYINSSILKKAIQLNKIKVLIINPLDFCPPNQRVDDKSYGGGPGMVLRADPIIKAIEQAIRGVDKYQVILFSPQAKKFNNQMAKNYSLDNQQKIILVCGRYEGLDARVKKIFNANEYSIGNYILTGGEIPALVFIDSVARQTKDVLGNSDSLEETRSHSRNIYTRPEILFYQGKKYQVPKILLSGNHQKIKNWRDKN